MPILKHHKNLSFKKWFAYPKGQQLLMIANELNRAKNWIIKNNIENVNLCYERAFELTDITISDNKWVGKRKELLRFGEYLAEQYTKPQKSLDINSQLYRGLIALSPESYNMLN
ncbi:MAG: hypothetical protein D8M58_04420 [Calditrichaeota bacterium]|nr:MAG: hypothetical protein DWQ03_02655 [Calditrichota bacterium]MBL1204615.1 hypothetical protein [Calditrichota bacterium]NOG44444.1 hypothetical protein [Calditrichota bacterium]